MGIRTKHFGMLPDGYEFHSEYETEKSAYARTQLTVVGPHGRLTLYKSVRDELASMSGAQRANLLALLRSLPDRLYRGRYAVKLVDEPCYCILGWWLAKNCGVGIEELRDYGSAGIDHGQLADALRSLEAVTGLSDDTLRVLQYHNDAQVGAGDFVSKARILEFFKLHGLDVEAA